MCNNPNRRFNSGRVKPIPKYLVQGFSFDTLNCGVCGDKVQKVLWRAQNLPAVKSVAILCDTNNLHLDAPEDIADGIIEIGLTFKRL